MTTRGWGWLWKDMGVELDEVKYEIARFHSFVIVCQALRNGWITSASRLAWGLTLAACHFANSTLACTTYNVECQPRRPFRPATRACTRKSARTIQLEV